MNNNSFKFKEFKDGQKVTITFLSPTEDFIRYKEKAPSRLGIKRQCSPIPGCPICELFKHSKMKTVYHAARRDLRAMKSGQYYSPEYQTLLDWDSPAWKSGEREKILCAVLGSISKNK